MKAFGGVNMTVEEIEKKAAEIRAGPLQLLCKTPSGKMCIMTICQCVQSKSRFVYVVDDALDALLASTLGGDDEPIQRQKRPETAKNGKEG